MVAGTPYENRITWTTVLSLAAVPIKNDVARAFLTGRQNRGREEPAISTTRWVLPLTSRSRRACARRTWSA
ncbi:MAG: hypothetical protein QOE58_2538 [Actinomycetota bacterium]|jgi:hypothetical protein|nr:hypothetical protein [Actinomycetota bacterium]